MEKSTGKRPAQLDGPDCPDAVAHLWLWFLELHGARSYHQHGPNPLTYQDIAAWAALTAAQPTPWEVAALKALDAKWLEVFHG